MVAGITAVGAAVLGAPPAAAATHPNFTFVAGTTAGVTTAGSMAGPTVSGHASAGTPAAETTTITLNAPHTTIPMGAFRLGAEDTLNLVFTDATDIVFFHAFGSSPTVVAGTVNTFIGSVDGPRGGNVWLGGISGVHFAATADVEVGGLLATSNRISSTDYENGTFVFDRWSNESAVVLGSGASVVGHGSLLAFIGPTVEQAVGATVGGSPDSGTEVLYGTGETSTLRIGEHGTGLGLLGLSSTPAFMTGGRGPILAGSTSASDVYVSGGGTSYQEVRLSGPVEATGAPADGRGNVVVAAGPALSRTSLTEPVEVGATGHGYYVRAQGPVTAARRILMSAKSSISLSGAVRLSSPSVALAGQDTVHNAIGSDAVDVGPDGQWVVYGGLPETFDAPAGASGPLDSGRPAVWGTDLTSTPPSDLTGNRYVFSYPPAVTFTAVDVTKPYGTALPSLDVVESGPHLGRAGLWTADEVAGFSGSPSVTSDGSAADARPLRSGPYPVVVGRGSLTSPNGYRFRYVNAKLTVTDGTPADVTATVSGPVGEGGWYTGDVTVDWTVAEPHSYTDPEDCGDVVVTADQPATPYTCAVTGPGGNASGTVTVGRDTTRPSLTVGALQGVAPYASGAWTRGDVAVTYTCTDATSGVARQTAPTTAAASGDYPGSCTDRAGHTTTVPFRVNIDRGAPVLSGVPGDLSLTTTGDSATATWATPTATDDEDAAPVVACDPGSGGVFPSGTTTVTCTATDHAGNTGTGTFTVTVTRAVPTAVTFRSPIDAPPVVNVAARNRVVPVRVSVSGLAAPTGPAATPLATGTPRRVSCPRGARTDAVETYTSRWPVPTNLFVYDPAKGNWRAKVDTRGLARDACYHVPVTYGGTVANLFATGGAEIGFFLLRTR